MAPGLRYLLVDSLRSVSVEFGSKERLRNRVFGILPAQKMGREPKKNGGGKGGKGRNRTNPWILKTPANGACDWLG